MDILKEFQAARGATRHWVRGAYASAEVIQNRTTKAEEKGIVKNCRVQVTFDVRIVGTVRKRAGVYFGQCLGLTSDGHVVV